MKKTILATLLLALLASGTVADVTTSADRVILTYDFSRDTAIQRCIGYGYMRYQCRDIPQACNICTPSDSHTQCDEKVKATSQESLDAKLPTVSRLTSGALRDVCIGDDDLETPEECESKITVDCGAIALNRNPPRCSVKDSMNITPAEWINCENQASAAGLCPARSIDDLPHFFGCLAFIDAKVKQPLEEARDDGRIKMSMDAKTPVDLSADDE